MRRAWLVVMAIGCGHAPSKLPPPPPPVAVEPAFDPPQPVLRLPRHFLPTRYTARVAIDPAQPTFDGEVSIEGSLDRRAAVIWLHAEHLDIASAKANDGTRDVTLAATLHGDLLELRAATPLDATRWTITIKYRGTIVVDSIEGAARTKLGADPYVITQFEAIAARMVFPCFDEPDFKVPWQLTLDVPKDQVAVSNTMPTGSVALDATHVRIAFAETRPLPSYLIAFAVGPFEIVDAGKSKSGVPFRVITPRGTTKQVAFFASAIPKFFETLQTWFQIPFPYPKLDFVIAPSLGGSAMENAGMIVSDARTILFDKPSAREKYEMVSVLGHETAHQWFGDLVTAAWWDDIWLNESFASWIEDKVLVGFDKTWPTQVNADRVKAFRADELVSARKIRQPITSAADIHNVFDAITYPKGAIVLRMLEHQLGEAAFQRAVQHYLAAHADGNATGADLFAALDEVAGKPLGALATAWFDQGGIPEVAMDLTCDGHGTSKITLTQQRFLPSSTQPSAQLWSIPVCVAFEGPNNSRLEQCTVLTTETAELDLPVCPAWFAPSGDYGYFHSKLDAQALAAVRDHAWDKLTRDERIAIYVDAAMYARNGQPTMELLWSLTRKLVHDHDDRELVVAIGDLETDGGTLGLPGELSRAIPTELLPAARNKLRAEYEKLVKASGIAQHGEEGVTQTLLHDDLIDLASWSRSHVLDAEAKKLFARYRELPTAQLHAVVSIAANADPKLAAQLRSDLDVEHDPVIHTTIVDALSQLRDPTQHRAMLESIVADPKLSAEDVAALWASSDEEVRADNEAFLRAHLDEVIKRLPSAATADAPLVLWLTLPFTFACEAATRDEIVAYLEQHFGSIATLARPLQQGIERMDNCIARKKLLEPSLRAWLTAK
jgi:alanyl aminopeptidase